MKDVISSVRFSNSFIVATIHTSMSPVDAVDQTINDRTYRVCSMKCVLGVSRLFLCVPAVFFVYDESALYGYHELGYKDPP